MDNWTQLLEPNSTSGILSCSGSHFIATAFTYMIINLLSFIITLIVVVELLKRMYKRNGHSSSSTSPTEAFLLQINLINLCNGVAVVLYLLSNLADSDFSIYFKMLHQLTTTAEPLFLLGLCATVYCAVVHPVTYIAVKNARHWQWMFIALVWVYTVIIEVVFLSYKLKFIHPVNTLSWFVSLPAIVVFNGCTMRTLDSSGPENGSQRPNPTKRKAFRIVLSMLVANMVYCVPQVCYLIYRFLTPVDLDWFMCFEIPMYLIVLCQGQVVLSVIFLYSIGKVGA